MNNSADDGTFARFAGERLGASAFMPDMAQEQERIFAASLASFRAHTAWTGQARREDGARFNLLSGFIERMTPNALADADGAHHVIVMHQALLATIVEFALFAFTQSAVFPEIGNAAGEASPAPSDGRAPGLLLLERTITGRRVKPQAHGHRVPKDAERHVAAICLALIMGRFVWLHELSHCMDGHVAYARAHGLASRLYEMPEPSMNLVGFARGMEVDAALVAMRALEFEADESALTASCRIQLQGLENIEVIQRLDLPTRLGMTLFGAFAMTWLFEEYQGFMRIQGGMTHPYPRARLTNLFRAAAQDIAPQDAGFLNLLGIVRAQFNALSHVIPTMAVWSGEEDEGGQMPQIRHTLRQALKIHRYVAHAQNTTAIL